MNVVVVENKGKNEKDFNSTIDGATEKICKKINTTEAEKITPRNDRKLLSRKCLEIKKERRKFKRSLTEKNDFGLFRSLRPGLMLIADQDSNKLHSESTTAEPPPSDGGKEI